MEIPWKRTRKSHSRQRRQSKPHTRVTLRGTDVALYGADVARNADEERSDDHRRERVSSPRDPIGSYCQGWKKHRREYVQVAARYHELWSKAGANKSNQGCEHQHPDRQGQRCRDTRDTSLVNRITDCQRQSDDEDQRERPTNERNLSERVEGERDAGSNQREKTRRAGTRPSTSTIGEGPHNEDHSERQGLENGDAPSPSQ